MLKKFIQVDFSKDRPAFEAANTFLLQMDEKKGVFARTLKCKCPQPLNLDQQKFRQFVSNWFDYILAGDARKTSNYFLYALPVLKKTLPKRLPAINAKLKSLKKTQPKRVEYQNLRNKLFDKKVLPEDIAALGIKKNKQERQNYYRQALRKVLIYPKERLIQFQIAILKHPESAEKDWLIDRIKYNLAGKTADEGNLDGAVELTNNIKTKKDRVSMLAFLSRKYHEKGEIEKANQLAKEIALALDLDQKNKTFKREIDYGIYSNIFVSLALIDTNYSFLLLETVLPESDEYILGKNHNLSKGIRLKYLLKRHRFSLFSHAVSMRNLAEADFDRLKSLANYFKYPEISTFAKVLILKLVIDGNWDFNNFKYRRETVLRRD